MKPAPMRAAASSASIAPKSYHGLRFLQEFRKPNRQTLASNALQPYLLDHGNRERPRGQSLGYVIRAGHGGPRPVVGITERPAALVAAAPEFVGILVRVNCRKQ